MADIKHLFIASDAELRSNWVKAFPKALLSEQIPTAPAVDLVWVLLPEEGDVVSLLVSCRAALGNVPIVAISDIPSDQQGIASLSVGVVGYCNGHATPVVLRQVSETVLNGGLWVGQWLLQKLLAGVARTAAKQFTPPDISTWASGLTNREIEVARAAATGLGNKEIANQLKITERTVKAHLGAVFDKLKLRDRMQLTLLVNGVTQS
jgi:DNA-binding NarL/FixJ family response regulator